MVSSTDNTLISPVSSVIFGQLLELSSCTGDDVGNVGCTRGVVNGSTDDALISPISSVIVHQLLELSSCTGDDVGNDGCTGGVVNGMLFIF